MNTIASIATYYKCTGLFCGWKGYNPKFFRTVTSTDTIEISAGVVYLSPHYPVCPECGSFCEIG